MTGDPPGPLLGVGRSADVYDNGDGFVLRRYRASAMRGLLSTEEEAALMEHVRGHGFPAPAVESASGDDIVMERIDGPTMLSDLARKPWRLRRHAWTLVHLHHALHQITAPEWLKDAVGEGNTLLHLDLHPDNVLLSPKGPVVIDWPNAARGPADADVAHTWIVMATAEVPGPRHQRVLASFGRQLFLRTFLHGFDQPSVASHLETMAARWLADRNVRPSERDKANRLVARMSEVGGPPP